MSEDGDGEIGMSPVDAVEQSENSENVEAFIEAQEQKIPNEEKTDEEDTVTPIDVSENEDSMVLSSEAEKPDMTVKDYTCAPHVTQQLEEDDKEEESNGQNTEVQTTEPKVSWTAAAALVLVPCILHDTHYSWVTQDIGRSS